MVELSAAAFSATVHAVGLKIVCRTCTQSYLGFYIFLMTLMSCALSFGKTNCP